MGGRTLARPGTARTWILGAYGVLLVLETLCAHAAFETMGEISQGLYWSALVAGNLLVILTAFGSRKLALMMAVLLGLAIIPYQSMLMFRHARVRAEAQRIVEYAYRVKSKTGEFPADLSRYPFQRPGVRAFVQGYTLAPERGGFQVAYCVGTETTSHWYTPKGGWEYYPD